MPKVAKNAPASDEHQVAGDAVRADGRDRFAADHDEAGDDDRARRARGERQAFLQHDGGQQRAPNSAAQDGWITPPWPSGTSRKPE